MVGVMAVGGMGLVAGLLMMARVIRYLGLRGSTVCHLACWRLFPLMSMTLAGMSMVSVTRSLMGWLRDCMILVLMMGGMSFMLMRPCLINVLFFHFVSPEFELFCSVWYEYIG